MTETIARVESILPPVHGRYTQRVTLTYRQPREGETDVILEAAEMTPSGFRGVFGAEPVVGREYRVTTEPIESGA